MQKGNPSQPFYLSHYKISGNKIVQYDVNLNSCAGAKRSETRELGKQARAVSTYSQQARKRFNAALDNFCQQFKAMQLYQPDMLFYEWQGKIHKRKPVFITLTVPFQGASDTDIKRNALDNILQNLKKNWTMNSYLWQSEAQERGAIHFHIVTDSFIPEARLRFLWYRNLKKLGCIPADLPLYKCSRICHFKVINNIDTAAEELAGYFEGERDENGVLIHKHDDTKRVRDITGRSWGCSDNLRYRQMTIFDVIPAVQEEIENSSKKTIPVETENGKRIATVYIRRLIYKDRKQNRYNTTGGSPYLDTALAQYHYNEARKVYLKERSKRFYFGFNQTFPPYKCLESCVAK